MTGRAARSLLSSIIYKIDKLNIYSSANRVSRDFFPIFYELVYKKNL
jgi:hypothetical protein